MWRRLSTGLIALALAASTVAPGAAAPVAQEAPPDAVGLYLALGDSVAAGIGATVPAEGGYVNRVFTDLQATGGGITALSNLAAGGETTASLISGGQLDRAVATIADPANNIRVVSLSIGGNDLLGLLSGGPCTLDPAGDACQQLVITSLDGFVHNYPVILQRLSDALAAKGSDGVLFVHTYYNPFSGTGTAFEGPVDAALLGSDGVIDCAAGETDPSAMGLNDILACTGAAYGAHIVDVQPRFAQRGLALTLISRRDIHPNDAGHTVIASALEEAVTEMR